MRLCLSRSGRTIGAFAVAGALAASVTGCGVSSSNGGTSASGSAAAAAGGTSVPATNVPPDPLKTPPTGTKKLCGTKPLKIAQVDGFGENAWRKIVRAELARELSVCPNVQLSYAQAGGDVQTYNTLINSYTAQGYNAILTYDDFGKAGLPALRNAYRAGLTVVPYMSDPGGVVGQDYTAFISEDYKYINREFVTWLGRVLHGKGDIVYMGGSAGNPLSLAWLAAQKQTLKSYPGLKLVENQPVTTDWEPAQYQTAMAGVLAKYKVDGIISDYGAASVGGIRAYINANKPMPPEATGSGDNQLGCLWQKYHKKWPNFQMLWIDGSAQNVLWAARRALADLNHIQLKDSTVTKRYVFVDTTRGLDPKCIPSLPADADLSSSLSMGQLKALFK